MRKILLTLALFTISLFQIYAACPVGDLTLTTQTEIDNFTTTYSDCTEISGSLTIQGITENEILNLDGLMPLVAISGDLSLINNQELLTISGLGNVNTIGGNITINDLSDLTTLSPLSNLTIVNGDLSILGVNTITSLSGLENIASINGKLTLFGLNSVTSLSALSSLTSVTNGISINFMLVLSDLTGLEGISSLIDLEIVGNTALINLNGLNNLNSLTGFLKVGSNSNLENLGGLQGLDAIGFYTQILSNPSLTSLTGLDNIELINGQFWIGSNSTLNTLGGLSSLVTINNQFNFTNNSSIVNFTGLESLLTIDGQLEITGNSMLNSLNGLDNITVINGDLNVIGNTSLGDCAVEGICSKLELNPADVNFSANATGCSSNTDVITVCQSLPVELSSFTVTSENGESNLLWTTASEFDNRGFSIQHSIDGNEFRTVGFVPGNGTTDRVNDYTFSHNNPIKGINYYRLKQIDFSETFAYSHTLSVHNNFNTLVAFPNPTNEDIQLHGYVPEQYDVRIAKIGGELVENIEGNRSKIISLAGYEPGIYVVQVFTSKRPTVFRVVKH